MIAVSAVLAVAAVIVLVLATVLIVRAAHDIRAMRNGANEQITLLRKQMKVVLTDAQRTNATAKRILDRSYRHQKAVDDILYHAERERERLNG